MKITVLLKNPQKVRWLSPPSFSYNNLSLRRISMGALINALLIIKIELDAGYYECKNCKYNF